MTEAVHRTADAHPLEAFLSRPLRIADSSTVRTQPPPAAPAFRLLATQTGPDEYSIRGRITKRNGDGIYVEDHVTGLWFPKSQVKRWDQHYVVVSAWIAARRKLQIIGPKYVAPDPANLPHFEAYNGDGGFHG